MEAVAVSAFVFSTDMAMVRELKLTSLSVGNRIQC